MVETTTAALDSFARIARRTKRGLVVVGPLQSPMESAAVLALARKLKWPLLPDILSGMRLGRSARDAMAYGDLILLSERFAGKHRADTILHIGGRPTSRRVSEYLQRCRPAHYIHVTNQPGRVDPAHQVTLRLETDLETFCRHAAPRLKGTRNAKWHGAWAAANRAVSHALDAYAGQTAVLNEPMVARLLSSDIPQHHGMFLASSMPIRDMNMFAATDGAGVVVAANRGASGIDGTLASATGFACGLERPVTLVTGDLALLHDLGSGALIRSLGRPMIIVAINNDGGGIFSFLPIAGEKRLFEKYWGTPHGLNFQDYARWLEWEYARPESKQEFLASYAGACKASIPTLIEVCTKRDENAAVHLSLQRQLVAAVNKALFR